LKKYIEKYELIKPFTDRKIKKFFLEFGEGINIIVGENGSGKSTLLALLTDPEFVEAHKVKQKIHLSPDTISNGVESRFLDSEKDNPRIVNDVSYAASGTVGNILLSHFMSHGEAMFPMIDSIKTAKDEWFLLMNLNQEYH
jgi:predicted ATPase